MFQPKKFEAIDRLVVNINRSIKKEAWEEIKILFKKQYYSIKFSPHQNSSTLCSITMQINSAIRFTVGKIGWLGYNGIKMGQASKQSAQKLAVCCIVYQIHASKE